jgi:hypothetical protein
MDQVSDCKALMRMVDLGYGMRVSEPDAMLMRSIGCVVIQDSVTMLAMYRPMAPTVHRVFDGRAFSRASLDDLMDFWGRVRRVSYRRN